MFKAISFNEFLSLDYKAMRDRIEDMVSDNHRDFVKSIISIEKGINDESVLDKLYKGIRHYEKDI